MEEKNRIISEAIEKAFNVNPDTVFGVLVGLLLIMCIYLLISNNRKDKFIRDMLKETVKAQTETNVFMSIIPEKLQIRFDEIINQIKEAADDITKEIRS